MEHGAGSAVHSFDFSTKTASVVRQKSPAGRNSTSAGASGRLRRGLSGTTPRSSGIFRERHFELFGFREAEPSSADRTSARRVRPAFPCPVRSGPPDLPRSDLDPTDRSSSVRFINLVPSPGEARPPGLRRSGQGGRRRTGMTREGPRSGPRPRHSAWSAVEAFLIIRP
jgi:hypothetical protein